MKIPTVILLPGEERELVKRWRTTADQKARDRLIYSCTGLIWNIANKLCRNDDELRKELIQEGFIGVSRAVEKYDPNYENRFATYAIWWIHAHIGKYRKRMPLEESLDAPIADDTDTTFKDIIADERSEQESLLGLNTEGDVQLLRQAAAAFLHGNEWEVIKLRYFSGSEVATLEEVGSVFVGDRGVSISRERVRQIEAKAIRKLRNGLSNWEEILEKRRRAKERAGAPHNPHDSEDSMSKIPEHVILSCIEKLGGKETYVSAASIAEALVKNGTHANIATPFLVGQTIKYMVKRGVLLKRQSGSKRTYRIPNEAGAAKTDEMPHAIQPAPAPSPPSPIAHTHEDAVFQLAIAMVKLGSELTADALQLSEGLREISSGAQKISERYRERSLRIILKNNNK